MKSISHPALLAILPVLTTEERAELFTWASALERVQRPYQAAYAALAAQFGVSVATVRRRHDAWRKFGPAGLAPERAWREQALAPELIEHWRALCERNQRKCKPAYRQLLRDFFAGRPIPGVPNDHPRSSLPRGWSYRNFMRFAPTKFELTAARIGRSAAAKFRPLVLTTRANLWVGSHYIFDDIWHDHFCQVLDTRQVGRPLEFHALDLYSGCKFAWGMQLRQERPDGTHTGLTESAMRFLLAFVLGQFGYDAERGTTLVVEHGTAAIRPELERLLAAISGGKITVIRGGIQSRAAFPGQFNPAGRGNPRAKAAIEALGNLVHNEMASLPAQTGLNREARPEGLHGLLQYNQRLLQASKALPDELARRLRFPVIEFSEFQSIAGRIYDLINSRTDHNLEGWQRNHILDERTGTIRRMSPREVFDAGRQHLTPLPPQAIAVILGPDLGQPRKVADNHTITVHDRSLSADPIRYLALDIKPGTELITVVNPFSPDHIYLFDHDGRFITAAPRIVPADRADIEAVHRACGRAAAIEARLLAPVAARGAALTRARTEMHRHNAAVLASAGAAPRQAPSATALDAANTILDPSDPPDPDDPSAPSDPSDFLDSITES